MRVALCKLKSNSFSVHRLAISWFAYTSKEPMIGKPDGKTCKHVLKVPCQCSLMSSGYITSFEDLQRTKTMWLNEITLTKRPYLLINSNECTCTGCFYFNIILRGCFEYILIYFVRQYPVDITFYVVTLCEFNYFVLLLTLCVLYPYIYSLKLETSFPRFSDSDVSQNITIPLDVNGRVGVQKSYKSILAKNSPQKNFFFITSSRHNKISSGSLQIFS